MSLCGRGRGFGGDLRPRPTMSAAMTAELQSQVENASAVFAKVMSPSYDSQMDDEQASLDAAAPPEPAPAPAAPAKKRKKTAPTKKEVQSDECNDNENVYDDEYAAYMHRTGDESSGDREFIDDDDELELASVADTYFELLLFDCVLRGKRWTGTNFVDVERIDGEAEDAPYTHFLRTHGGPVAEAISAFEQELATNIERWSVASSDFVHAKAMLENVLEITPLEETTPYRQVLLTYADTNTVGGHFRQHIVELDARADITFFTYIWFVTNVRIVARNYFFLALAPGQCTRLPTLYSLLEAVVKSGKHANIVKQFRLACEGIDAYLA
jgi:hypothetical protein